MFAIPSPALCMRRASPRPSEGARERLLQDPYAQAKFLGMPRPCSPLLCRMRRQAAPSCAHPAVFLLSSTVLRDARDASRVATGLHGERLQNDSPAFLQQSSCQAPSYSPDQLCPCSRESSAIQAGLITTYMKTEYRTTASRSLQCKRSQEHRGWACGCTGQA